MYWTGVRAKMQLIFHDAIWKSTHRKETERRFAVRPLHCKATTCRSGLQYWNSDEPYYCLQFLLIQSHTDEKHNIRREENMENRVGRTWDFLAPYTEWWHNSHREVAETAPAFSTFSLTHFLKIKTNKDMFSAMCPPLPAGNIVYYIQCIADFAALNGHIT